MKNKFYGWYFRCQSNEESIALIPALHLSKEKKTCSIQILTSGGSWYQEFPASFFRMDRTKKTILIGSNVFSHKGIFLDLTAAPIAPNSDPLSQTMTAQKKQTREEHSKIRIRGAFHFGPFTNPKYDIMGPFRWLPFMECRHMVYSMKHPVEGTLLLGEKRLIFHQAVGYMEGDQGTSFPKQYFWTHAFLPEGSLMFAAAAVPIGRFQFTGTIGYLLLNHKEYRFASYLGASVLRLNEKELVIRQGSHRFLIRLASFTGSLLHAPSQGAMNRQVKESVDCQAEYIWTRGRQTLFHRKTSQAAFEYDGTHGGEPIF